MKNEKLYVISETTYHKHIDAEVHLYGLVRQLAFLAGKITDDEDMEHLQASALGFGEIAEELMESLNIPGRYLSYGDKDYLSSLKEMELIEVSAEISETLELDTNEQDFREMLETILGQFDAEAKG